MGAYPGNPVRVFHHVIERHFNEVAFFRFHVKSVQVFCIRPLKNAFMAKRRTNISGLTEFRRFSI